MLSAVLWVDNNPANAGPHPLDFTTISAAVGAASPGDTIKVSPGIGPYDESVLVNKQLTLIGGQIRLAGEHGQTIVEVPTNGLAGFDLQANDVTVKSFTVRPDPATTTDVFGIVTHVANYGEQILNNVLTGNTIGLYLNSNGVKKDSVSGNTFASNNFPGSSQGNAIYSDQGLKNATISNNYFSGDQNGSVVLVGGSSSFASVGAHSNVQILYNNINNDSPIIAVNMTNSRISGNSITNPLQGTGIFFGGAVTKTEVSWNKLNGNAGSFTGINLRISDVASGGAYNVAHTPGGFPVPNSGDKIVGNTIYGWGDSGIRLRDGTNGVLVAWNSSNNNGTGGDPTTGDGISIEDSYSNTVAGNTTNNNRRNGIFLTDAQINMITCNTANNNGVDGIRLENGSNGNTLQTNSANHNGEFVGFTGNGIHLIDSNDNTIYRDTAKSNANDGILVEGTSAGNTLRRNFAKFNLNWDLEDTTVGGTGTAGTDNFWFNNIANSRNPAGLG